MGDSEFDRSDSALENAGNALEDRDWSCPLDNEPAREVTPASREEGRLLALLSSPPSLGG